MICRSDCLLSTKIGNQDVEQQRLIWREDVFCSGISPSVWQHCVRHVVEKEEQRDRRSVDLASEALILGEENRLIICPSDRKRRRKISPPPSTRAELFSSHFSHCCFSVKFLCRVKFLNHFIFFRVFLSRELDSTSSSQCYGFHFTVFLHFSFYTLQFVCAFQLYYRNCKYPPPPLFFCLKKKEIFMGLMEKSRKNPIPVSQFCFPLPPSIGFLSTILVS